MAFAIPKIEYKNGETIGTTTSGSGTISGVEDTSGIEAGMFISGSGIPTGAVVESVTTTSVLLANGVLASSSVTSSTLSFGFKIEFDFPPKEANGEELETKATTAESLSGIRQVSVNYTEGVRTLAFSFVSPAIYLLVDSFLKTHALLGNTFRYFDDKTLTTYVDCELDTLKVNPKKIAPKGEDTYVWEFPLKFRRVL